MNWSMYYRTCLLICIVIIFLMPVSAVALDERYWYMSEVKNSVLVEAREIFLNGSAEACLAKLNAPELATRLAEDRGQSFQRQYMRALSLYELKRPKEALEATNIALGLGWKLESPDYARLTILRSQLFLRLGDMMSMYTNANQAVASTAIAFTAPHPASSTALILQAIGASNLFQKPKSLDIAMQNLVLSNKNLKNLKTEDLEREPWASVVIMQKYIAGNVLSQRSDWKNAYYMFRHTAEVDARVKKVTPGDYVRNPFFLDSESGFDWTVNPEITGHCFSPILPAMCRGFRCPIQVFFDSSFRIESPFIENVI